MIFSIIVLVLVLLIAYFHFLQGFFTATISTIIAVIAAAVAVGYHEVLIASMLKGKLADQSTGIVLCCLFAGTYIILRFLIDKLVPGNIRLPVLVDKVGGAVMGIIAGLFATGIMLIAAQSLPLNPSIAGYSRYATYGEKQTIIPGGQSVDAFVYDQLKVDSFTPSQDHLLIPADDFTLGAVSMLSNGALSGDTSFKTVHPDYLQELFGQRTAVQVGAKRTALNLDNDQIKVTDLFTATSFPQKPADYKQVYEGTEFNVEGTLKPGDNEILFIVRMMVDPNAGDEDGLFRFSPGAVRLVANGKNYYPVATLEGGNTAFGHRIDDPLMIDVKSEKGADLVFKVNVEDIASGPTFDPKKATMPEGVFFEAKRYGRVSLAGKSAESTISASPNVAVLRKSFTGVTAAAASAAAPAPAAAPTKADDTVFVYGSADVSDKLFTQVGLSSGEDTAISVQLTAGQASLKKRKFDTIEVDAKETLNKVADGDYLLNQLFVSQGKKMIQIKGTPSTKPNTEPWAWAQKIGQFELVDSAGNKHKPVGAWAKVKARGLDYCVIRYVGESGVLSAIDTQDGRPVDVWIAFVLPETVGAKELLLGGGSLTALSIK